MSLNTIDALLPISELGFGKWYGNLMVESHFTQGAWSENKISPLHELSIHPGAKALHYAQEIFEGLKAYKQENGIYLFRPQANIQRMTRSAGYLAMPSFPEEQFLQALTSIVSRLTHLVPEIPGSLYLRPTLIGCSSALGVAPASNYLFYVLASPVGGYFGDVSSENPATINVWISDKHVRAVRGGLGAAKTGANYAASLRAVAEAKKLGFNNVMFLDAIERCYIEELSGMNVFIVEKGVLKTPPLGDTILAGVTRDSLIQIARSLKIEVQETLLDINEILKKISTGSVSEMFACGTASVITSIRELGWMGEKIRVGTGEAGPVATKLYQTLSGIHSGKVAPLHKDWLVKCDSP